MDGIAFSGNDFYIKNGYGDITALTDANGTITKNYQFDAFGNQQTENESDINPFRYSGEYFDAETGMIHLRNRYYDSSIGRFITEDPIKDGLNWYVYCSNNPIIYVDIWGLKDVPLRETVEKLGGTVTWNQNEQSATVSFGSAGCATYTVQRYQYNPKDTSSSLFPHLKLDNDLVYRMYIDDNILYSDFGIVDSESRYIDDLKSTVVFVLFEQNKQNYQRMTLDDIEYHYTKVNYGSFYYQGIGMLSRGRYKIGYGNVTNSDKNNVNKEWKDFVRDGVDVLGSDPSFSQGTNFIFSLVSLYTSTNFYSDNIIDSSDKVISFAKAKYYIDSQKFNLIAINE